MREGADTREVPEWWEEYETQVCEVKTPLGWVLHLKVRRRDGRDGIPWDVLQAIKNAVAGEEATAIEFYPAASDLVDEVNMRHLWVIEPDWLPFGLHRRG